MVKLSPKLLKILLKHFVVSVPKVSLSDLLFLSLLLYCFSSKKNKIQRSKREEMIMRTDIAVFWLTFSNLDLWVPVPPLSSPLYLISIHSTSSSFCFMMIRTGEKRERGPTSRRHHPYYHLHLQHPHLDPLRLRFQHFQPQT